ncbi:hypothetical protein LINGRAHAP2_LOCUS5234 [Linum grandiflorum]
MLKLRFIGLNSRSAARKEGVVTGNKDKYQPFSFSPTPNRYKANLIEGWRAS